MKLTRKELEEIDGLSLERALDELGEVELERVRVFVIELIKAVVQG